MTSAAPTPDVPTPTNLLADLESRQDELLRLLTELEERTKQALANLTASAQSGAAVAASTPSLSETAPSIQVVGGDEQKPARAPTRARSRKAA